MAGGIDQNGQLASGLATGDYVAEVTATSTAQGTRTATMTHAIKVTSEVQNTDAAFVAGLQLAVPSTDNTSSVTFNARVTSSVAATSAPTYSWTLPQGSGGNQSSQSFTVVKTSQAQSLSVKVTVKAGSVSRVLSQTITVPALVTSGDYPAWVFGTAYKTGDIVSHKGQNYKCITGSWCAQNGQYSQMHYEPGVGLNWSHAWKLHN